MIQFISVVWNSEWHLDQFAMRRIRKLTDNWTEALCVIFDISRAETLQYQLTDKTLRKLAAQYIKNPATKTVVRSKRSPASTSHHSQRQSNDLIADADADAEENGDMNMDTELFDDGDIIEMNCLDTSNDNEMTEDEDQHENGTDKQFFTNLNCSRQNNKDFPFSCVHIIVRTLKLV